MRVRAGRNVFFCWWVAGLAGALSFASGCISVSGEGDGTGVVASTGEDGAEIRFEEDRDVVWDAAYAVADDWGAITRVDREKGTFEAKEGDTTVTAEVETLETAAVRVRFRARKLGSTIPDRERAEILSENLSRRLAKS